MGKSKQPPPELLRKLDAAEGGRTLSEGHQKPSGEAKEGNLNIRTFIISKKHQIN